MENFPQFSIRLFLHNFSLKMKKKKNLNNMNKQNMKFVIQTIYAHTYAQMRNSYPNAIVL